MSMTPQDGAGRKRTAGGLRSKQEQVLRALLGGASISDAAREAGVRRATASAWVNQDDAFRAELHREQGELRRNVRSKLEAGAERAVEVLVALLEDESARTRLLAAKVLVQHVATASDAASSAASSNSASAFTGEAERERLRELTQFSASERENMRQLLEVLVRSARVSSDGPEAAA